MLRDLFSATITVAHTQPLKTSYAKECKQKNCQFLTENVNEKDKNPCFSRH